MPESRSWGHRISRLRFDETKCSAPNCSQKPKFRVFIQVEGGARRLNYCESHALAFSQKFRVAMPNLDAQDAERVALQRFSSEALEVLQKRIADELKDRKAAPEDVKFAFSETAPKDVKGPYVARLYVKGGRVCRFFFNFQNLESEKDRVWVHGLYGVRPGSIVEKRLGDMTEESAWNRYLITKDGAEVLVAMKGDVERNELVERYLRRAVGQKALLQE